MKKATKGKILVFISIIFACLEVSEDKYTTHITKLAKYYLSILNLILLGQIRMVPYNLNLFFISDSLRRFGCRAGEHDSEGTSKATGKFTGAF